MPKLNDSIHFTLYYPEEVRGQCRAAWVNFVNGDGSVNLTYFTAGQEGEPDNPPAFTEFKFKRLHDATGEPGTVGTWHYTYECPHGR